MKSHEDGAREGGTNAARRLSARGSAYLSVAGLFSLALAVRLVHLARSPHRDELFHILAARALLADGTLVIDGEVPYDRASSYTYLLAALFKTFGESLVVARLPGILAGAALVALLFWWVRKEVGSLAAWIAALLLCFDPWGLWLSQLGRFYGLHALLFCVGALAVYHALSTRAAGPRLALLLTLAAGGLGLAYSLQSTTLMGGVGLLVWVSIVPGSRLLRRIRWTTPRALIVVGSAAAVVTIVLFLFSGPLETLWTRYTSASPWARARAGDVLFYHEVLATSYPTLWSLAPIIAVAALALAPRIAGFCAVLFAAVFLFSSLGAMKHPRYLFFVMPFFFTLSGIAIAAAIPWLHEKLVALFRRWTKLSGRIAVPLAGVALVIAAVFAAGSNRGPYRTLQMLTTPEPDVGRFGWQSNWKDAAPVLRPILEESEVFASSWPLTPWYYLGRLDVSLHGSELIDDGERLPEFTVPRWFLPRPTISEPTSLALLVACSGSGLAVVERGHWRNRLVVSDDMADYMIEHLERVSLPDRWGLHAFRWRTAAVLDDERCPRIEGAGLARGVEATARTGGSPVRGERVRR